LFFCIFYTSLFANTISIDNKTNNCNITEQSNILIDKQSKKSITEVVKPGQEFVSVLNNFVNYGYMFEDTVWVKFTLQNSSDDNVKKYLVYNNPNIAVLNFYLYNGLEDNLYKSGIFNRKVFNSELSFKFEVKLKPHEIQTYYLELKPMTHSLNFNLKIQDYETYKNSELHHQIILAIFFGILFVIMIYNTVIFLNSKNLIYIYYSIFIASLLIHHLSVTGMIAYFLPSYPDIFILQSYMTIYYTSAVLISIFIFVRSFLNTHLYKRIDFVVKIFILLIVSVAVISSNEKYLLDIMILIAAMSAIYLEFIGIYLFIKGTERHAKYFFIIWSLSLISMFGSLLFYAGILPTIIPYLFETTVIAEALLFSMILANEINRLQKEKLLLSVEVSEQKEQELEQNKIILEQSKLASMGEMLRNIAHQWRQPLSEINAVAMKIDADFYKNRLDSTTLDSDIKRIENLTHHMSNTIESFTSFFKENKQLDETTLKIIITKALNILEGTLASNNIKVKLEVWDESKIKINISEFMQVVLVILNNAIDALVSNNIKNKIITIRVKNPHDKYILEIEDNAGGVKDENMDKIFEPYFTTKFKSEGIGIGLYMAKLLVEKNKKATLAVSNTKEGAKFIITL